jgi:hypothetical protein
LTFENLLDWFVAVAIELALQFDQALAFGIEKSTPKKMVTTSVLTIDRKRNGAGWGLVKVREWETRIMSAKQRQLLAGDTVGF